MTVLTERYDRALGYASALHRAQCRKVSGVPYLGHLLSTSALVIEGGGSEDQAIAGLLHDAAEDQGGEATLKKIGGRFGEPVAQIVRECSDTFDFPKPEWGERKRRYIDHLTEVSDDTILVSLADKLDNVRAILRDYRQEKDRVWQRFTVQDPELHFWYYRALLTVYQQRNTTWLVDELARTLKNLVELVDSDRA